ncbi:MAG TPA: hypothetical protein VE422_30665 [Terriglobia bacterium]|nr:hypothetical protein [Terriglobia bacterium]
MMGILCVSVFHDPKIKPASCFQLFMTEQFLDVPNRATISEQIRSHGVADDVRRHLLVEPCPFCIASKRCLNTVCVETQPGTRDKQCRTRIATKIQVAAQPFASLGAEKDSPLLISLSYYSRFALFEINVVAIHRERFGNPHPCRRKNLYQGAESISSNPKFSFPSPQRYGLDELIKFFIGEIHNRALRLFR